MSEITRILSACEQGDPSAAAELLPLVYEELRQLAAQRLSHEQAGQTLDATALVHEAYLRLVGGAAAQHWNSRGHFFGAAAEAMRRILVENARRKHSEKRGGKLQRVNLDDADAIASADASSVIALDEALEQLAIHDASSAQLVKLHCFAGLSIEQAADALGLSRTSAYRQWTFARAWLYSQFAATPDQNSE